LAQPHLFSRRLDTSFGASQGGSRGVELRLRRQTLLCKHFEAARMCAGLFQSSLRLSDDGGGLYVEPGHVRVGGQAELSPGLAQGGLRLLDPKLVIGGLDLSDFLALSDRARQIHVQ
jgi:hypothetical protein